VADEHDRARQRAQELGEVGRVAGKVAKRVGEPDGAESFALESADFGVEARRIGPCTVDKDDRRFAFVGLGGHVSSSRRLCPWTAVSSLLDAAGRRKLAKKTAD
jgi:hypothetical protein